MVALGERGLDGGKQLFPRFDFRDAEAASAGVRLDEQRQARLVGIDLTVTVEQNLAGHVQTRSVQGAFAGRLVERDDRCDEAAGRVRDSHHVQISLQPSVLARRAVNQDQGVFETNPAPAERQREVVAVQLRRGAVRSRIGPAAVVKNDFIYVVFVGIEYLFDQRGAFQRDFPFGRVSAGDQGDFFLHGSSYIRPQI